MAIPPVPPHARVPARRFDEPAAAAARARLADAPESVRTAVAWLAGCLEAPDPALRERLVVIGDGDPSPLTVEDTARHVDQGRELAAAAGGEGITVLVASGESAAAARVHAWLTGAAVPEAAEIRSPLGGLRRLGDADLAALTGVALGAGEQGLACVCAGAAATAAAALAVAIEPGLRPRLLATDVRPEDALAVLRQAVAAARVHNPLTG